MNPMLHINLLGKFRLIYGDQPVTAVNTPRLQSLLAYLVLNREAPQLRQHVSFLFWPDSSESQARTNLRKLFFQLRRALPDADLFLQHDAQTLQWNPDAPYTLDVAELQGIIKQLEEQPLDQDALTHLLELYTGELLPSCYDEWVFPERQGLHQAVSGALESLVTLLENQRAYEEGIRYAQRLLEFDPLEEKTYQCLMRLHALNGDRAGALRVYHDCTTVLGRELGVEPGSETQASYERLVNRDPALTPQVELEPGLVETLPLVGRQREWGRLQSVWREVRRGGPHLVSISGEAGIGKTRLAEELLSWAGHQGITAAKTRCYAAEGQLAYAPVTQLLRAEPLRGKLSRLGDVWLGEITRLLPELLETRPGLPRPEPLAESGGRQRFFEALARAVLIDDHPLILALDDVHWCDRETLEWLRYLMRFDRHARLLIVGTVRREEVAPTPGGDQGYEHPLASLLFSLRRDGQLTEINLGPLNLEEAASLGAYIAGHELDLDSTHQLYQDTEGNPLFVVETLRAQLGQVAELDQEADRPSLPPAQPDDAAPTLPPKVQAVISSRLAQLSPQAQELVTLAAVVGRSFTFDVLAQASDADEDALVQGLDELWRRGIVAELRDQYDFSHDKFREVAYRQIGRARRRWLHRRVAQALETIYPSELGDQPAGTLAHHYVQAGDDEKAVSYMVTAGDQARALYANAEAESFYQSALRILQESGQNELAARTLMKLGLVYTAAFEPEKAEGAYAKAFTLWKPEWDYTEPPGSRLPPATLRVAVGEPVSLDPGKAYDSDSSFFQVQLFEGLVAIDQDQNVLPAMATHWEVADGGSNYIFYLRPGVDWSDGTPLRADQFEYAWKRNLDPATNAPAAHLLYAIRNARAYREGEINDPDLIGVKALDSHSLEIRLEGPTAYLPYLLADPITFPLPRWTIQAHGAVWATPGNMVTNGPYMLLAWQRGEQLVLERNPYYTGRFPGNAERVECRIFTDHRPGLAAYAAHDLDVADMASGEAEVMAQIRSVHSEELTFTPRLNTNYLIFGADREPFNDVRVRKAFAHAVDREALIRELMQEQYLAATGGVVPPGMPGHSPDIGLAYDPEAARHLLAGAGYPGGEDFPCVAFLHTHGLGDESFIPLLQKAWSENLGVDVEVTTLAWEPFLSRVENQPPDLMLGGWIADYPDPDNFLRVVFHSREGLNEPRWHDSRFDALVEEATRLTDKRRRLALYQEADCILVAEEAVILPLSYGRGAILVKPWVSHVSQTPSYSNQLKELIVEKRE